MGSGRRGNQSRASVSLSSSPKLFPPYGVAILVVAIFAVLPFATALSPNEVSAHARPVIDRVERNWVGTYLATVSRVVPDVRDPSGRTWATSAPTSLEERERIPARFWGFGLALVSRSMVRLSPCRSRFVACGTFPQ